jgi:hypothetical protein
MRLHPGGDINEALIALRPSCKTRRVRSPNRRPSFEARTCAVSAAVRFTLWTYRTIRNIGASEPKKHGRLPWSVEDTGAAYVVKDSSGQKISCLDYEDELGPQSAAKLHTKDEARRIAANVAKLPELLRKQ